MCVPKDADRKAEEVCRIGHVPEFWGQAAMSFKLHRLWSALALALSLVFVAAIAYLVLIAPGNLGYRTIFESLRLLAQIGGIATIASLIVLIVTLRGGDLASETMAFLATVLFAVPVATMALNEASPPPGDFINDITTDLENPPEFNAVIPLREPGSNPIEYGGPEVAAVQRDVHPEVEPIMTSLSQDAAFQKAFETAEAMGWEIVAGDPNTGIIEAIATTPFFRFKDDIVIRVRGLPEGGSRVDVRSRSRVGLSDLGTNAARIVAYADAFEAAS
jgi:uncharacterized protein (DUF1499 family)